VNRKSDTIKVILSQKQAIASQNYRKSDTIAKTSDSITKYLHILERVMSTLIELEDEVFEDEVFENREKKVGSLNHGIVQSEITGLLLAEKRFRVVTEFWMPAN